MEAAKILVVEDERIVAMHLKAQLSQMGYTVPAMATAGKQALKDIEALRPDVVLMDIHIEGEMDGIETAARIPPELQIPVIYLTAYSEDQTLDRARATQPYGYLLKPFSERELHATIQMVLERRRADRLARESEQRLEQLVAARTAALVVAHHDLEQQTAERLKAEQTLHQAQKMEAVGHLTGGIAHDFNNALTVIIGNVDEVQRSGEVKTPYLVRSLNAVSRVALRSATLTQRLLAFSRLQPLDPQPINLNTIVSGMSDLLKRTLGETVNLEIVSGRRLWWVAADENQMESALLNLALNGRDAMPQGGKLTIETGNIRLDADDAALQPETAPGCYTMMAVSDTGIGMSPAVRDKAFEPFFTTKKFGLGTGLGLSQVYGFIKQSGGHVTIDSTPGEGTTVRLYLPRLVSDRLPLARPPEAKQPAAVAGGETILVVEDDVDVRAYSAGLLRKLGYRIVEAQDGPSALRRLDLEEGIELVFTDVGLPGGLDGGQLADEIRRRHPGLPILFTSGYPGEVFGRQDRLASGAELLKKPFTYAELTAKIRSLLDGGGRAVAMPGTPQT